MPSTPYMKLYIGDYLGDTQHLSTLEHGAYILLIMAYWQNGGPLSNDPKLLRRLTRTTPKEFQKVSENVLKMFQSVDGVIVHKRIEKELKEREQVSIAARNAINTRWYGRNTDVLPTNNERNTTPIVHIPENINTNINKSEIENTDVLPMKPKAVKHKYGEYDNVLLSDAERDRLTSELGEPLFLRVVTFYSGWKKEKGRVSKDDNLTIRRWVIDAVRKQSPAPSTPAPAPLPQIDPIDPDILATVNRHYAEIEERERARV